MKNNLTYRTMRLRKKADGEPATMDPDVRSVEVVGATENPVEIFDWDRLEVVKEVLRMDGAELPANRQIPFLDSHQRWGSSSVLGSYRDMETKDEQLEGRVFFSTVPEAEGPFTKVREGHLTDFSIGYRVMEFTWVPDGKKATVNGRTYEGPIKVSTRWAPKELSVVPIGADEMAKARAEAKNYHKPKEVIGMDEKLRKRLEARGLPKDATEEEALAFLDRLTAPETGDGAREETGQEARQEGTEIETAQGDDPEEIADRAIAAERRRVQEIRAMCSRFGVPDELTDQLVNDGTAVEEARKKVMEHIDANRQGQTEPGFRAELIMDGRDKFRAAALDSILVRSGIVAVEKPAPGHDELIGFTLQELARESLRMAGKPIGGTKMEMIGRAMTTGDFPYILADAANKSLFAGYETAPETWRDWCAVGQASDFKTHSIVRASEFDDLDEIPEHGEYKYGEKTEGREQFTIAKYGKLFAITRETIVNDDLGALTDVPRGHGEAAARKIGDLPYAVLTANAAMGDGTALFHADHGNLGTGGVVSETTIGEAIKLMKLQKDIGAKRRLNIRAQFLVGPVTIEGAAEIFFTSNQFAGASTAATRNNPYAGSRFTRVYEARLDDDSTTAYYVVGPKGKTVTVFFLNGVQAPYLETKQGWTVDGVEYKVRIEAGAKAVDWKALVKNAGA